MSAKAGSIKRIRNRIVAELQQDILAQSDAQSLYIISYPSAETGSQPIYRYFNGKFDGTVSTHDLGAFLQVCQLFIRLSNKNVRVMHLGNMQPYTPFNPKLATQVISGFETCGDLFTRKALIAKYAVISK